MQISDYGEEDLARLVRQQQCRQGQGDTRAQVIRLFTLISFQPIAQSYFPLYLPIFFILLIFSFFVQIYNYQNVYNKNPRFPLGTLGSIQGLLVLQTFLVFTCNIYSLAFLQPQLSFLSGLPLATQYATCAALTYAALALKIAMHRMLNSLKSRVRN